MTIKYHRLTFIEREEISKGLFAQESYFNIAKRLNRETSTVSREVHQQVKRKRSCYSAVKGQLLANEKKRNKGRPRKLGQSSELLQAVQLGLRQEWSPEEIAQRLKLDYPNNMTMRISHESIYQYLYCLPKGELKKELMKGLRQERKLRLDRKAIHARRPGIQNIISISERPEEVRDRIVPGHWEGDLIVGKLRHSALGTLVERTTRLTLLVPLKEKDALAVSVAFAKAFQGIPKQFTKTLTYDRGTEMAAHQLFTKDTKIQVYFADPHSPWQRGTNENTNGLIRQYFPKGTDFKTISIKAIREVERRLNSRPRKILGFHTPAERFYELTTGQKIALGA